MKAHDDDKLLREINQSLDDSIENLDAETRSTLNQARQKAIAIKASQDKKSIYSPHFLSTYFFSTNALSMGKLSLGSVAVAAAVFTLWVVTPGSPPGDIDVSISSVDMMPIEMMHADMTTVDKMAGDKTKDLAENYWQEDPELMDELEFMAWLIDDEMMNGASSSTSVSHGDQYAG